jgi:hypothetical protein
VAASVLVGFGAFAYVVLVPWLAADSHYITESTSPEEYTYRDDSGIRVWTDITAFNPRTQQLDYAMRLEPTTPLVGINVGNTFGLVPGKSLLLRLNDFEGRTTRQFPDSDLYQGIQGTIRTTSFEGLGLDTYPNDAYLGDIFLKGDFVESFDVASGQQPEVTGAPNFEYRYRADLSPPATFSMILSRQARLAYVDSTVDPFSKELIQDDVDKGFFTMAVVLERSNITKLVVGLLVVVFVVLAALALLLFMFVLVGHRPPSLSALVWANTLVFTLIVSRFALPGDPPIGIDLDVRVYFPALLVAAGSAFGLVVLWLRRNTAVEA